MRDHLMGYPPAAVDGFAAQLPWYIDTLRYPLGFPTRLEQIVRHGMAMREEVNRTRKLVVVIGVSQMTDGDKRGVAISDKPLAVERIEAPYVDEKIVAADLHACQQERCNVEAVQQYNASLQQMRDSNDL